MAIGGIPGALLAGLEGYSQARAAEQKFATAELERQRNRMALDYFQQQQQAAVARWRALQRLQQPLAGGGGGPMYPPGAGGMGPTPNAPIQRETLPPLPQFAPTGAFGGGDQGAAARTRDASSFPLPNAGFGGGDQGSAARALSGGFGMPNVGFGGGDQGSLARLSALNGASNGFSGSSMGGGPGTAYGAGGDDTSDISQTGYMVELDRNLAPGFERGPTGGLTYQGRPPDTYLGGRLPGGGAVPAWRTDDGGFSGRPRMDASAGDLGSRRQAMIDKLVSLGVRPEVAAGAVQYANRNESRLDPSAVNPTSGALGVNQWLGDRKAALQAQYGQRPSFGQQVAFTGEELQGPERATLDRLRGATTAKEGYDIWGASFERPGSAALAKAGVGGLGIPPDHPIAQAGRQTLMQTVQNLPQMLLQSQMMSMQALIKAINDANPDASDAVKAMAFTQGMELLAPYEKERAQLMIELMKKDWQLEHEDIKDKERIARESKEITGTPFQVGEDWYATTKTGDTVKLNLPPGAQRVGTEGGTVLQGPTGPLFVDKRGVGRPVTDPTGKPITEELSRPGTQPRNVPAMMMDQYKKDFQALYNRAPSADEMLRFQNKVRRDQSIEAAFGGGIMGRNMISLNTFADHVAAMEDYAAALANDPIQRINQIANRIATEAGNPLPTNFNAARTVVGDELARLLTTTGGTEADRQQMQAIMDPNASPEQLKGAINVMKRLVRGRLEANQQQYAGTDPERRERFQTELLTDNARKMFQSRVPTATEPQGTPKAAQPEQGAAPSGDVDEVEQNGWIYDRKSGKALRPAQ